MANRIKNEIGNKYGKLTVIGEAEGKRGAGHCLVWLCECECGNKKVANGSSLRRGVGTHCGCVPNKRGKTHGKTNTPEFKIWQSMLQRCFDTKASNYEGYGGRGISVCDSWRGQDGFENFLIDMGERPSPSHSIDRRDNNKGYDKENCRWATPKEQARNKGTTNFVYFNGAKRSVADLSEEYGINISTLTQRLQNGWDIHTALNSRPHNGKRNQFERGKINEIVKHG